MLVTLLEVYNVMSLIYSWMALCMFCLLNVIIVLSADIDPAYLPRLTVKNFETEFRMIKAEREKAVFF